ncbi:MAG: MFS transporter [Candidatus Aenigmarchaeota archaeon]|nr:MFS transporter [Candidatus Aenigmarchaeota archaeon]
MSFRQTLSIKGMKPVLFSLFMASLGFGIILPILPFYALSLGAEPFQLGMLTATFALMSLIFAPFLGRLAEKKGRKNVILICMAGYALSYLLFAFTNSLAMAFVARGLQGFFTAGIMTACVSLITDMSSESQRGKAMGLFGMTFSLGFIMGPAIGGFAAAISVQTAFLLAAVLSIIGIAYVHSRLKEPPMKDADLGRSEASPRSQKAALFEDIVQKEVSMLTHISSPLLLIFMSVFMVTFMIGGMEATLALYTSERLSFTSAEVGLIFTFIGSVIMIVQYIGGSLVNKVGEIRLIRLGLALSGLGFFLLVFASNWISLLVPVAIFVTGNAIVFPSANSLLSKKATGDRGAVLGLATSFRSFGQFVGPLLAGFLYGINHSYAFLGLAVVILVYFVVFSIISMKKLK